MAKISASLADVSTEFVPAEPGVYIFEIQDVVEGNKEGRITYQIKSKIMEVVSGVGEDSVNKTVVDFVSIHKADGSLNQYGLITMKRYFEAVLGRENVEVRLAEGDEPDTDELKGQRFKGQIEIDSYFPKGVEEIEENRRYKNVFKAILSAN